MKLSDHPFGPPTLPADLLAQVGQSVASTASQLQAQWPQAPAMAAAALLQLEQLGLQLQAVVRVLAGPAQAQAEAVDLGLAALQARAEWGAACAQAGARWAGPQNSATVHTNAAVLKQLLDLALAHALGLGTDIAVDVVQRDEPALVALRIEVTRPGGALFESRPGDAGELHWALLTALAAHAGVVVERQVRALGVELLMGWPGDGAPVAPSLPDPASLAATPMPAGCRVLLLEPHEPTRLQAQRLMLQAGLHVRTAVTVDQARALLDQALPECLVTGIEVADPACTVLLQDLRARQPGLRVVELSRQPHDFATSLPQAGRPARVAREALDRTLIAALAQELTAPHGP
jgi:hypothetical protein